MAIEFITNAITSVFKNEAAKDAIINAAITKAAGGTDKQVLASGLGTFASQEYGTPKTPPPFTEGVPQMTIEDLLADILEYRKGAEFDISMGDPGGAEEKYTKIREAEEKIDQLKKPAKTGGTPQFIKTIGDYLGFGGLDDLKEKYLDKDSAFRTPLGEGLPSLSGLALPALLGYMAYDSAKDRKGGIALTPQVMMDSLGRYQMASDMGTGGTRAEFGLGPKPSVLNVAGGGEINRQYFNQGGIAELDMRDGGESEGPGTGTSDDIPAMLSDGEYVMTAKATRGAGAFDLSKSDSGITLVKTDNPDRERGVANMRELMNIFEEI